MPRMLCSARWCAGSSGGRSADQHGLGVSLPVSTKSVRRERQAVHRNRRLRSRVSPRPAATKPVRSASAWCRRLASG
jgi:hypothetical protein